MPRAKAKTEKKQGVSALIYLAIPLLVVVLAILMSPAILGFVVENNLERALGVEVRIGKVGLKLTPPGLFLEEVVLGNPSGFPQGEMALVEAVRTDLSFPPVLGALSLKGVDLKFEQFRLLRNESGQLNLPQVSVPVKPTRTVGEVSVSLDTVTYTDLSGPQPSQVTFDLGLENEVYRNVKGIEGIIEIVGWEILKRTGIEREPKPDEETAEAAPGPTPTAELPAEGQNEPAPAAGVPSESAPSQLSPSLVPSVPGADEPK